jgi:anaerobic selenocysteine-containing dehydrogenase
MGFEDECFSDSVDEMVDQALASPNPWLKGIDRPKLEKEGHVRLNFAAAHPNSETRSAEAQRMSPDGAFFLPFAFGNFPTPSGKAELYNKSLVAEGLDPVANFVPPSESRHGSDAKTFPLELLARKADNFLNSTFSNLPSVQEMEEAGLLEMNPRDAENRRIIDGDKVRVFNGRGEIVLKARVDSHVQPGVVSAHLHWAKLSHDRVNINVLTSEKLTDMGNSATFYSVLVEVGLFKPAC